MALARSGRYTFGKVPYGIGDAGWQLVSFYGSYWDMLHLRTASSPFFNWEYGMGVPYFGDWVNYSASPYLLLLWFFPRNMLEFALMFITGLILATAAAAMAAFLKQLLPEARYAWIWGVAWASSGWLWDFGIFRTMWLQGLVVLPLLGLGVIWSWRRQYFLWTIAIVAFAWIGNYYSAFMASLAAGFLCVVYYC